MALSYSLERNLNLNQVLVEEDACVKKIILNRPEKLNSLTYEMVSQMLKNLEECEKDSAVKLVILKGNGKAFCAGGDVLAVLNSAIAGHWSFSASFYKKQLILDYVLATYKKPLVSLVNGIVMGGGAGISMRTRFRIVTEKTVFAMPEASMGISPDVGASHFLSRLPGCFGEYLGLTGARLDGMEMVECGLATHFVLSKNLPLLENALPKVASLDASEITELINKFVQKTDLKQDSVCRRLNTINKCFSRKTVEEILMSLEKEAENGAEKWILQAVKYMKSACPTSLKVFLRLVREGRRQTLEQCLISDYIIFCHLIRRTFSNDLFEGSRAMFDKENKSKVREGRRQTLEQCLISDYIIFCHLIRRTFSNDLFEGSRAMFDKENKSKHWEPSKLELVNEEMVNAYFTEVDDCNWKCLQLPARSNLVDTLKPKL